MAERQIALLRGINVGKAKRVTMADLRAVLEGAGFGDVRTLLQSGNVVCSGKGTPKALAARMEKAFLEGVGFSSRFTVLPLSELDAILAAHPLPQALAEPSRYLVAFLAEASLRPKLEPLTRSSWDPEAIVVGDRVGYLWCPSGQAESKLAEGVARALGDQVTTRNWSTLTKLQALAHAPQ